MPTNATPLTTPLACLLIFVGWTFVLLTAVLSWRGVLIFFGGKKFGEFPASVPHGSDPYWRLNRVHLNALENLPIFATLVLVGHLLGARDGLFATLCEVFLVARVGQAAAHASSGSSTVIAIRFTFFLVSLLSMVGMLGFIVLGL